MGSNSSRIGDLPKNEYLKKLSGTESVSENDPFWNQLLSFSFPAPTSSTELKLLEEATISVCRSLAGLWTVFTLGGVGSKAATPPELSSPLANQSLLLLLVLANLTDAPDAPNPYRQAIMSFKNTQDSSPFPSSIPHTFQINFNSLYTALCEQQTSDQATLLLYTLLHQNSNIRTYMLARTDMENLVLPILEILYHVEERNSHHVYMALIILLILTEDDGFNRSIHEVILKNITWYSERVLTEISLGSLLILVVIRTIQYNMTRTRDKYLHTNCLAALANMSAQFRSLHQYAAQRIISLFSLLSKKHNKVLEQATQSLRGSLSSNDVPLPDYVITFFSSRLLQAGAELSVERVLEIIKQGVVALPKDRLKKFPELKFKYVEEEQPEEFFIPYVWSLVYNSAVGLYWNPQDIQLFTMDSD
ncbi:dymeclin isoform 24 [Daubentonia madagascariensis]|uniref:Dymeclin n=1 Tax=Daubentonia madagascariensis TaxID=31869 RepID=A0ABD2EGU6_DAUMA